MTNIYAQLLATLLLMLIGQLANAQQCENLIALSKTVNSTVADKSAFEKHAANFCNEYRKSGSSSSSTNAGASYKFISASFGQSNMSTDEVASKVCSANSGESSSTDAYKNYVETIATGAYSAYETCVRFKGQNDLRFDVDTASLLPAEFTIVVGYLQAVQGADTANLSYSASNGVACSWNGDAATAVKLRAPSSIPVKCSRSDQTKPGYVKITRTNGVGGSLTVPWPAYDKNGLPIATLDNINSQLAATQNSLKAAQNTLNELRKQTNSTSTKPAYICPVGKSPGVNPNGGAWGFYGCQGQITTESTCQNIEYPWNETRGCTPAGRVRFY